MRQVEVFFGLKNMIEMDDVFDIKDQIVRLITIRLLGEIELNSLGRHEVPTEDD